MSDKRYIINKDSLTGIADAVRDKLGVGEVTTDPQTGDIVYPEGKGYYTDTENIDYIAISDYQNVYQTGSYGKYLISCTQAVYPSKAEKPFSQIEIEGYFYWYSMSCNLVVNTHYLPLENSSTTLQKITETFDTPQSYFSIRININNKYYTSQNFYFKDVKILLKDENGDPIKLVSSGFPASQGGTTCTIETVTQEVQKPIPYSVADITNNIEDYWNIPEGSLNISANGTYDVTEKASAVVNVPNPSTGSLNISANGTYDVTDKASAIVSVSPNLQAKTTTISQNGSQTITPDSNYDGLSAVNLTISVPNPSTGSLEITENGTYDVTDKASAVVNVPTGGGGGGTAPIPTYIGFDRQNYRSSYINLHDYISQVQNEQDVMSALLGLFCSEPGLLAIKPTGGFYSYKQLGWANPSPTISGLTTEQIADAYDNNRIIPLIKYSDTPLTMHPAMNQNQIYIVIVGTKIYFCYQSGSYSMNWCYVLTALY